MEFGGCWFTGRDSAYKRLNWIYGKYYKLWQNFTTDYNKYYKNVSRAFFKINLSRCVFKTQLNMYDGDFFQKQLTTKGYY